jgi:hypothetical protein
VDLLISNMLAALELLPGVSAKAVLLRNLFSLLH